MGKKTKDKGEMGSDKERQKMTEEVAKHMRFKITIKSALIKGRKIEYFPASKAVDCLMESKWTKKPADLDSLTPYFNSRPSAIDFCTQLLRQRFIIRLKKVEVIPKADPLAVQAGGEEKDGETGLRKRKEKVTDSPRPKKQGDTSDSDGGKKKKRKFRVEIHDQQTFIDSAEELYFWEYDPPSRGTYIIGFGIVVGAVALTLQPLWPDSTRAGLWYASMGLFGVMGFLVLLIVARWFLFGLIQVFSVGKLYFWVLPNLDNEKCGFFESFQPFYSIEWKKDKTKKKKKSGEPEADKQEEELTITADSGEKDNSEKPQVDV